MKILSKILSKNKKETILIKRITYLRIFIIWFLLATIDTFSSYFIVKHPQIYEMNSIASVMFGFGWIGLTLWYICILFILSSVIIISYALEKTFFNSYSQQFRMKLLYLSMGMYLFVFFNNLRTLINIVFLGN